MFDVDYDVMVQFLVGEMVLIYFDFKVVVMVYGKVVVLFDDVVVVECVMVLVLVVYDDVVVMWVLECWQVLGVKLVVLVQVCVELVLDCGDVVEVKCQLEMVFKFGGDDVWCQFGCVLVGVCDVVQVVWLFEVMVIFECLLVDECVWLVMSELGDWLGWWVYVLCIVNVVVVCFYFLVIYVWVVQMMLCVGDCVVVQVLFKQVIGCVFGDIYLCLVYVSMLVQGGDYLVVVKFLVSGKQSVDIYNLCVVLVVKVDDKVMLVMFYCQLQKLFEEICQFSVFLFGQLVEMQGLKDEVLVWYD